MDNRESGKLYRRNKETNEWEECAFPMFPVF